MAKAGIARLSAVDGSLDDLLRTVAEQPGNGQAALALGCAIISSGGEPDDAAKVWVEAVQRGALTPEDIGIEGVNAYRGGRDREALALLKIAATLKPTVAALHANLGMILLEKRRHAEAMEALGEALKVDPNHVGALLNLGSVCLDRKAYPEALAYLNRVLKIEPDNVVARLGAANASRQICQWRNVEQEEAAIAKLLAQSATRTGPFLLLSSHMTPKDHLRAARVWAQGVRVERDDKLPPAPPADPSRRIRIGYLSNDYYNHATTFLAVEMFERHDREKFEIFAYSHSPDDKSDMRRRVVSAFDHFVEIERMSNPEAARRIRADGIDILVDLKGYTQGARSEIMALRPAPVQVNFLGYPGSMGADFIDYVVGDRFVTPLSAAADYDEKIVQLPHCYQPNDRHRRISETLPSRAACGCRRAASSSAASTTPTRSRPRSSRSGCGCWTRCPARCCGSMRPMRRRATTSPMRPRSSASSPTASSSRPMPCWRIIWRGMRTPTCSSTPCPTMPTPRPAMRSGPVCRSSLRGETFAARVAASLLDAVGMPELITTSLADYEALALALARDPERLAGLKARLVEARATAPLFDSEKFTRDIEAAYQRMHALRSAGKVPEPIVV